MRVEGASSPLLLTYPCPPPPPAQTHRDLLDIRGGRHECGEKYIRIAVLLLCGSGALYVRVQRAEVGCDVKAAPDLAHLNDLHREGKGRREEEQRSGTEDQTCCA